MYEKNFLGLSPYQPPPLQEIVFEIANILKNKYDGSQNIEIEFKYGEVIQFFKSAGLQELQRLKLDRETENKVLYVADSFISEQNRFHYDTLKKLSNQSMILLNRLERRYNVFGDFQERVHKKFYKIREFLVKLCKENSSPSSVSRNFFNEIRKATESSKEFRMINFSEMRLDFNVKNGEYAGRYSYEIGKGWTKTYKENMLKQEFDIMMCERAFRLAVKQEVQEPVDSSVIKEALKCNGIFLRIKRSLKVQKGNKNVITLSEIYQPKQERRNQLIEDLADLCLLDEEYLQEFIINRFQQFYMSGLESDLYEKERESKFEIQSEFTQEAVLKMAGINPHNKKERFDIPIPYIERLVDCGLQDLYSLFLVDHRAMCLEAGVMEMMKKDLPGGSDRNYYQCRLQNQFGSYMHDMVYSYMKSE